MEAPDEAMEMAAGASGAGCPPKHFNDADKTMTKNGKHLRREYNKVASVVSERGQASAGLRQERTAMGPRPTVRDGLGRRGGTKNPGV